MSRTAEGLRSVIGFWAGTAIVIGCTVGSGIFRAPGEIAQVLPHPPLVLLLWLVLGLVSLCGALTLAELVCRFPQTGGSYVYLRAAYGDAAAFAFGWLYLVAATPSGIGTLAMVFSERVMELRYGSAEAAPGLLVRGVAAGTILLLSAANVIGVRFGASIQALFTVIKVAALLGLLAVAGAVGQLDAGNLATQVAAPAVPSLAQAAAFVIFTYNGWVYIGLVAGELSDARRQIKRTIIVSMAVIIGLYLAANLVYHLSLPVAEVAREQVVARRLASDWLGPWGGAAMSSLILASVFGTLNGVILTNARVPFALARSGLGFSALGRVHPRFATPHVAIGVQAAVAIALFWLESFARLSTYFVLVEWSALVLAIAAIFVLRRRTPATDGYRTPGYPLVPLVFVVGAGGILISIAASTWSAGDRAPVLGLLIAAAGLPLYHVWRRFAGGQRG